MSGNDLKEKQTDFCEEEPNGTCLNGLGMGLGNLAELSKAVTRSISAENFTGEKGKAGMAVEGTGAVVAR